jgi:hypothetical protein
MHFRRKLGAGLFGGEGFILQKLTGPGLAFVEIAGEVQMVELAAGKKLRIDPGHIAMYEPTCAYDIEMVKGVMNWIGGGEGLFLATVTGPGKVWLQTMPLSNLAGKLRRYSDGLAAALIPARWAAIPARRVRAEGRPAGRRAVQVVRPPRLENLVADVKDQAGALPAMAAHGDQFTQALSGAVDMRDNAQRSAAVGTGRLVNVFILAVHILRGDITVFGQPEQVFIPFRIVTNLGSGLFFADRCRRFGPP